MAKGKGKGTGKGGMNKGVAARFQNSAAKGGSAIKGTFSARDQGAANRGGEQRRSGRK
jgi:hypothetical protein